MRSIEEKDGGVSIHRFILPVIATLFVLWGLFYIYHSSFVAIDGHRYFSLFDDAMISMRYAWNFAHGQGLVWNSGERVEGYTNLLMTLLMSIPVRIFDKSNAVLAIQLIGLPFVLGAAWFTLRIFRLLHPSAGKGVEHVSEYLLFSIVLAYYPLSYWSLLGMETGLLTFLLTGSVLASLLYVEKHEPKFLILSAFLSGLAFLARNDSLLYAVWMFVFMGLHMEFDKRHVALFMASLALYGFCVIGQEVLRFYYYHSLVPNTYLLKLGGISMLERIRNGWGFMRLFIGETGFFLAIAFAGLFLKYSLPKLYLFVFMVISMAYQIYVGGDSWNYWRMMTPAMPLLLIVFILGDIEIVSRLEKASFLRFSKALYFLLPILGLGLAIHRFLPEMAMTSQTNLNGTNIDLINVAIALNKVTDRKATVGVFDAGILPYYLADHYAIDFLGKSDPHIARLPPDLISGRDESKGVDYIPGHNKYDLDYSIKQLRPTYIEYYQWGNQDLYDWTREYYVRAKYKRTFLYLLKDSPFVDWQEVQVVQFH